MKKDLSVNMAGCCSMKGFLSFSVLRMLAKSEMSGEDIREELEKRKGAKPSAGTIYPVLKCLHEDKLIEEIGEGQKEKKYRLTAAGHKEVDAATKKFVQLFHDMKDDFK